MKVRVLYNTDGSISVIKPAVQSKKGNEAEKAWLNRVFAKANPDGADYEDIEDSELPDHNYRDCWVKNPGGGVMIDTDKQKAHRRAELEIAVDSHIDNTAQGKGYDSRITCAIRASYENPWQEEGVAFGKWMDSCYAQCNQLIQDVDDGKADIPTKEELIKSLPEMVWP